MNDLSAFFAPADGFTVEASLDGGLPIDVHFDDSYIDALGVGTSGPAATCKTSDVAAAALDSTLTIGGTAYKVRSIEPDGAGVTVLRLHRSA